MTPVRTSSDRPTKTRTRVDFGRRFFINEVRSFRVFQFDVRRLISPPRAPTHGTFAVFDIAMLGFIVAVVIAAAAYAWLCRDI
jgi:hypothetical protein